VSRSLSRGNAILLAAVVLVAVGLGILGVFTLGGWFAGGHFDMRAGFDEVRGVEPGTRVLIRGVPAGEVVAVERAADDGPAVVLRLRIKNEFRNDLREGVTARVIDVGMRHAA